MSKHSISVFTAPSWSVWMTVLPSSPTTCNRPFLTMYISRLNLNRQCLEIKLTRYLPCDRYSRPGWTLAIYTNRWLSLKQKFTGVSRPTRPIIRLHSPETRRVNVFPSSSPSLAWNIRTFLNVSKWTCIAISAWSLLGRIWRTCWSFRVCLFDLGVCSFNVLI